MDFHCALTKLGHVHRDCNYAPVRAPFGSIRRRLDTRLLYYPVQHPIAVLRTGAAFDKTVSLYNVGEIESDDELISIHSLSVRLVGAIGRTQAIPRANNK